MIMQSALIFVRHAESIGNVMDQSGRAALAIPNHAYPLTERGRKQARLTGEWLQQRLRQDCRNIGNPFCSTFRRSEETLQIIMDTAGLRREVIQDSRLDEKWDGVFHEFSLEEIERLYPGQKRISDRAGYYHHRAPGGESGPDVEMRIRSFVAEHLTKQTALYSLVVGHGRWLMLFQKLLQNLTVSQFLELKAKGSQENCSVMIYEPHQIEPKCLIPWEKLMPKIASENA